MKRFALAGNPNSGKTTLFNILTGSTAHVGNWPGVTVDKREGTYKKLDEPVSIIDLPGIYSLSPYTPEEVISLATVKAQEKLLANNNKIIEVTDVAVLDKTDLGSKIKLNLFFTVIEDITKIIEITKEEIPKIDHKPNES